MQYARSRTGLPADAAAHPVPAPWNVRLLRRLPRRRGYAIPLALSLVAAIAAADYFTGYELRLAILYLAPIAIATWGCGRRWGLLVAGLGPLAWAASFSSRHTYSCDIYFYWDCFVMAATFVLVVELLSRLRSALERSDERFLRVLDGLYAAVYVADEPGHVLYANRRLVKLIGAGPQPTAADIAARFAPAQRETASPMDEGAAGLFTGAEVRDVRDGHWYLVQAGHIPWVDRSRVSLQVMTDITEQKLAQALQRERQEALHHTSRLVALAEAASTLAHELNQPLIAIVGYNAACIRLIDAADGDRAELQAAMEKCRAQAVRAGEIINRLRALIQRRAPELAWCDLNATIRQTLAWSEADVELAHVQVELALTEPPPQVRVDRILIEQVILNLVQNAIDAMREVPPERRKLRIACVGEADGAVKISVSDQGEGISPAVAERLYSPFFTTRPNGFGLGLSICRSIVEMHGGRIWHGANADGGAAFHFVLPSGEA